MEESFMANPNWDQVAGKWKQLKGEARTQWGKLTDDEWDKIAGQRDKLIGRIQEAYGVSQSEAEKQVDEWSRKLRA
jgi:uncharacterized protein YjbJ (UPF0337 family)